MLRAIGIDASMDWDHHRRTCGDAIYGIAVRHSIAEKRGRRVKR